MARHTVVTILHPSDSLFHPPLSLVFFFQSSSTPTFLTSLLPCSSNYAALLPVLVYHHGCHHDAMLQEQRTIWCSKQELLSLKDTHCTTSDLQLDTSSLILPSPLRKRKRGRKGGLRARTRRRGNKLHLPSIFLGNVQSLNNKVDELCARTKFISDYRNA